MPLVDRYPQQSNYNYNKLSLDCRLQVVSASVDELTCRFVDVSGRKHVIHANITETYPASPPVWFSESEDGKVAEAVACLAGTAGLDNHMLYQVKTLVRNLCSQFALPGEKHGLDLKT